MSSVMMLPVANSFDKQEFAQWMANRIPKVDCGRDFADFVGISFEKDNKRIAGILINNYTGFDVNLHIAADSPRWASRGVLKKIADLIFNKWGCKRITAIAGRTNKEAIDFNTRLGFILEGVQRKGLDGEEDALIFGMLRDECKWLQQKA